MTDGRPGAPVIRGGSSTAVGSMPGSDPVAAARLVIAELDTPTVPELPARGVGADMIGRAGGILVDIPMDTTAFGYRLAARPTQLMRRARDLLNRDLDAFEQEWERSGRAGDGQSSVLVSCVGPFTLSAMVELPSGHKVVHDRGAWEDVVESLGEGLAVLRSDLERRLRCQVGVTLDEPMAGRVIDGQILPLSRLDVIEPIEVSVVAQRLGVLADRLGAVVLHNCARPRWDLVAALESASHGRPVAIGVDLTQAPSMSDLDALGAHMDSGGTLVAGVVPAVRSAAQSHLDQVLQRLVGVVDRIGLARKVLAEQVLVSPTCGLAGADADWARAALTLCTRAAQALAADPAAL